MRQTILHARHVALGARMGPFAGYEMPIQYSGILEEHAAARRRAALFDTCHMGRLRVEGPSAAADLERLLTCAVASLPPGCCRYGMLCNPDGGVLDDLLVYRLEADAFLLVVNAGTQERDREWIGAHASPGTRLEDFGARLAKIDLQGPAAPAIARALLGPAVLDLRFYRFCAARYRQRAALVSRTGYTGEAGFEVYLDADQADAFWVEAMEAGALPAGLGARNTLRLEAGLPLYGHELTEARLAAESGFLRLEPGKDCIGAAALRDPSRARAALAALYGQGRRTAREQDPVLDEAGREVGVVTSASYAPSLGHAIALAYVEPQCNAAGRRLAVRAARQALPFTVGVRPFYTRGTARADLRQLLAQSAQMGVDSVGEAGQDSPRSGGSIANRCGG